MKIVYNGCACPVKKFSWATCRGPFEVLRKDGRPLASVEINDSDSYTVSTLPDRIISRDEIIPTVRLYLNAQRIRKTLADAETMIIQGL